MSSDDRQPIRDRRRWLLAIAIAGGVYWAIIFAMTHVPLPPGPVRLEHADKAVHATIYFGLAVIVTAGLSAWRRSILRAVPLAVVVLTLNAILDEASQALVPTRHPSLYDVAADLVGVALGVPVGAAVYHLRRPLLAWTPWALARPVTADEA